MVSQTEEALGYAAEGKKFADDFGPVSNVTFKDAGKFVAEMTPIVGDAMAAKEVYDELQKEEPNYYLAGALGGAALVGLIPGLGDVAAKAIRKGAREVFDVAKRVEVDPNAMGSGLGNVKLKPKEKNKLEDFGYYEDNPTTKGFSDDWMSTKQRYAEEDAAKGSLGATKKFFNGPITATLGGSSSQDMFLDTKFVSSLKGANDEVRNLNDIKFQELKKDILKEGFDPDQKGNKIVIGVNHKGDAFILEGNTRAAIAKEQNIPSVKTEVRYWNGAETVDGKYTPEKIIEKAVTKQELNMAQGGAIPMNNQMELFGEGGLKDEGGEIDEVSGNKVPIGGTKEGVRDDIPANVSEGEFIFPADVVRFIGLDKLMKIRQNAKMGLKKMEAMGQMGNSDEATIDDDVPFEMADLIVVGGKGEPMEFADGGFVPVQNFQVGGTPKRLTFKDLMGGNEPELVLFVNAAGEKLMVPFVNGVPLFPIPTGYTVFVPVEGEEVTAEDANIAEVVNALNTPRAEKEYDPMKGVNTKPTNWMDPDMDGSSFLEKLKTSNMYGTTRTVMEVGLAFVPALGFLGKMAFRHQDKAVLAAIEERAKRGDFNTPELQEQAVLAAEAIEKASSSVLGKVFDAVGGLLGKEKDEIDAAVRIQDAINEANKNGLGIVKTDKGGIGLDFDYSEFYDAEGNLKTDTTVTSPVITSTGPDDGLRGSPSAITSTGPDDGLRGSPQYMVDGFTPNTFGEFGRPIEPSTQTAPVSQVRSEIDQQEKFPLTVSKAGKGTASTLVDPRGTKQGDLGFSSLNELNTKADITPIPNTASDQTLNILKDTSETSYDPYANIAKVEPSTVTQPVKIVPPSSVQAVQLAKDKDNDFNLGDTARNIFNFFKENIPGRTIDSAGNPITDTSSPTVKTGDGGIAEAQAIRERQARQSDDERQAEREAARAATKTTKAASKTYSQDEARAATDKAVEKFGRATGGRAKGGLATKPVKTKKTKKTKKRGLAAR
jgi:hypothetical protein